MEVIVINYGCKRKPGGGSPLMRLQEKRMRHSLRGVNCTMVLGTNLAGDE